MSLDVVGKFHDCLEERVLKAVSEYLKHAPKRVKRKRTTEEETVELFNIEPPLKTLKDIRDQNDNNDEDNDEEYDEENDEDRDSESSRENIEE